MTDLGVPSGASSSTAIAISSNGEILGLVQAGSDTEISRYSNGVWTELGTGVQGTVNTLAAGINSSGQIVGSGTFPGVYSPRSARKPAVPIGFIYINGAFVDLNTLIPANSGFHIAHTQLHRRVSPYKAVANRRPGFRSATKAEAAGH